MLDQSSGRAATKGALYRAGPTRRPPASVVAARLIASGSWTSPDPQPSSPAARRGIGEATARALAAQGAKVVVADLQRREGRGAGQRDRRRLRPRRRHRTPTQVIAAVEAAKEIGPLRALVNSAGIGWAQRTIGKDGSTTRPTTSTSSSKVIEINLIGTFDCIRLAATAMSRNEPLDADGERGAIVNTASVAAFDGQIGQASYSASKGGVVGMTLPVARDLSAAGIRVNTIAPGPDRHPDLRRRATTPRSSRPTSARTCCSPSASVTPTSSPAWPSSAHQQLHERRDDPRRRRHPDAAQVRSAPATTAA